MTDRDLFVEAAILYILKQDEENHGIGLSTEEIYQKVNSLTPEDEVEVIKISKYLEEDLDPDQECD